MCRPPSPGYVIMLAGANQISSAAVGLVYLCAVGPAILCKVPTSSTREEGGMNSMRGGFGSPCIPSK